jgi:hypothetical protein
LGTSLDISYFNYKWFDIAISSKTYIFAQFGWGLSKDERSFSQSQITKSNLYEHTSIIL